MKDQEPFFKAVLEAFDGQVYVCSSENRIEYLNQTAMTFIGRDVTGEKCYEAIYGQRDVCPWCGEQKVFDGDTARWEFQNPRDNRWYYYRATPIKHQNGSISKLTLVVDFTKRKEAEEALKESERRITTLMNNLPGMAFRCQADESFTMVFASNGSVKLLGYQPQELLGTNVHAYQKLVNSEDRKNILQQVRLSVSEKRPFSFTYRVKAADGVEKWVWEQGEGVFSETDELIALEGFIADATDYKEVELDLKKENLRLRSSIKERYKFGNIIGKSPAMQEVYELILRASSTNANVVIYGESGTGKELVAQAIHELSDRHSGGFVPVNCGAIPENLLESEFFGHRKGAYTSANKDTSGYLDVANGGTLFLDELGEIGLNMQVKLLRVLEGRGYTPVGGNQVKKSDFRVIAATNRDLVRLVNTGKMREDFFYRIHILPVHLPPLRERKDDIPLLIEHFLNKYSEDGKERPFISIKILEAMQEYDWPGNVRELHNVLHSYITLGKLDFLGKISTNSELKKEFLHPHRMEGHDGLEASLRSFEREIIIQTLNETHWNRGQAAVQLKTTPRTLYRKMKELMIK